MNAKIGSAAALVTLAAVAGFALSMLFDFEEGSYLTSLFIAWGFAPMIAAFAARARPEARAAGLAAGAFAAVYVALVAVVYFAQLTTVRLSGLTPQAAALIDYRSFGLFFSLDLLGYAFMALSTFFAALTVEARDRPGRWLKGLMMAHGAFAVPCVALPMLGVFRADMAGGDLIGVIVLECWCAYFIPVCALAHRHFRRGGDA